MELDRRWIVAAGLGLTSLGASAAAAAGGRTPSSRAAASTGAKATDAAPAAAFDVVPDSGRDETSRLQAAIDRAAEHRVPLSLPPGRFIVRGLLLRPHTRVTGTGRATVLQHVGGPSALAAVGGADIAVEDIAVSGAFPLENRRGLVELIGCKRLALSRLDVDMSPENAIVLERCSGSVIGCRIAGAAKAGIFSLDADGGVEIAHNHLSALGDNGILVWRSAAGEDGSMVAMNRIERIGARRGGTGENGNGINIFRAGGVIVTSNRIADCAFSAVRANSASNVQILANSIARMGEVAIYAEFAFEGATISGNLIDGAATGISVTNFDHGGRLAVVQGNLVRNLSLHRGPSDPGGYGIAVEADAAITGNTIEGAPTAGLLIGWGPYCRDVAATGNVIRASAVGIAVTADAKAGAVLIASNMISGARSGAIRSMDHGRLLGGDLAMAGAVPPGRIRLTGNVVA